MTHLYRYPGLQSAYQTIWLLKQEPAITKAQIPLWEELKYDPDEWKRLTGRWGLAFVGEENHR